MIYFIMMLMPILICILTSTSSCSNDTNLKKVEQGHMSIVTYKKHTYVVWSINAGGGIVHDPDCICKKGE